MGTFKRIKRIIKAEMNDSLNNPEKALSKQIEAMEATIVKLRQSNFEDELAELKAQVTNSSNNFTDSAIDNELEELRAQLNDY